MPDIGQKICLFPLFRHACDPRLWYVLQLVHGSTDSTPVMCDDMLQSDVVCCAVDTATGDGQLRASGELHGRG